MTDSELLWRVREMNKHGCEAPKLMDRDAKMIKTDQISCPQETKLFKIDPYKTL